MATGPAAYKVLLHAFCGKRQVQPSYEYEEDGDEFYCEVRGGSFLRCPPRNNWSGATSGAGTSLN